MPHTATLLSTILLLAPPALATPSCPCGYTLNTTDSPVFTEIFETDFLHVSDLNEIGWIPQNYSTSSAETRGPFGMAREERNLVPKGIEDPWTFGGSGVGNGDPGLGLWVRGTVVGEGDDDRYISTAELVTSRSDILYGSFRIAMKTTSIPGTCSAFFFYRNDSQELDVEILSSEQRASEPPHWPIHLVTQSTSLNNTTASSQHILNTTLHPPTENYNEYRIDWLPSRVEYYLNGVLSWTERTNVPSAPGRLHISHWSNGSPGWSWGPPGEDARSVVSYLKAYFNSSSGRGESCGRGERVCVVPDQRGPANPFGVDGNVTGRTVFLSEEGGGGLNGTGSGPGNSVAVGRPRVVWAVGVLCWVLLGSWLV